MNEDGNSTVPQNPSFSSPNIKAPATPTPETPAEPQPQVVTNTDVSEMAKTDAGVVATAAAAMPENDARSTVNTASTSRSRLGFSNRRYSAPAQNTNTQMFAGAPDYFNQAAGDIYLGDNSQEKSSKKKIIIIAVIAAVLVIGACIGAALIFGAKGNNNSQAALPESAKSILSGKDFEYALDFEEAMVELSTNEAESIWDIINKGNYEALEEKYAKYNSLSKAIEAYNTSELNSQQRQKFDEIKATFERVKPKYAQIMSDYKLLYGGFKQGSKESIAKLLSSKSAKLVELAKFMNDAYAQYNELDAQYQANCADTMAANCLELSGRMADIEEADGAAGLFLDYMKSQNGGKSFKADARIYDEIAELKGEK